MTPSDTAQPAAVYVATASLKPWAKENGQDFGPGALDG